MSSFQDISKRLTLLQEFEGDGFLARCRNPKVIFQGFARRMSK